VDRLSAMNNAAQTPQAATATLQDAEVAAAEENLARGDTGEASARCEKVLASIGDHPRALYVLGKIAYQAKNLARAEECLNKALAKKRSVPEFHYLLGNIYQDQGRLDRAISAYRRAIRFAPDFAEAHNDLGTAYHAKGWDKEAVDCYAEAVRSDPRHFIAHANMGASLRRLGRFPESRRAYLAALKLRIAQSLRRLFGSSGRPAAALGARSGEVSTLTAQATAAVGKREFAQAAEIARRALELSPQDHELLHLRGYSLGEAGQYEEGMRNIREALRLKPNVPEFHINLGNLLVRAQRFEEAIESYRAALQLEPGSPVVYSNLSRIYLDLGMYDAAIQACREAVRLHPSFAAGQSNLATSLWHAGDLAEAESHAREAIRLAPAESHGYVKLAVILKDQGRIAEARQAFRDGLLINDRDDDLLREYGLFRYEAEADADGAIEYLERSVAVNDDASAHFTEGMILLGTERFKEGWRKYEYRKRVTDRARAYGELPYPEWGGESFDGRAVLVYGEQGIGDEIMFAGLMPEFAPAARRRVLFCDHRLEELFRRSFAGMQVHGGLRHGGDRPYPVLQGIDFALPAGSLGGLLRPSAESFPIHSGYLRADPRKIESWRTRLAALGPGRKIGLCWRGGVQSTGRSRRSLDLEALLPMLSLQGLHWVSLQYGDHAEEIATFSRRHGIAIQDWRDAAADMDELAALICGLDHVVSVCNATVHLTGALGRAATVLAPMAPEWRYGLRRERMLWYPSVRVLRQSALGDWSGVIEGARYELRSLPGKS
jgi:tetratricopeptide (TPR) repeat protein